VRGWRGISLSWPRNYSEGPGADRAERSPVVTPQEFGPVLGPKILGLPAVESPSAPGRSLSWSSRSWSACRPGRQHHGNACRPDRHQDPAHQRRDARAGERDWPAPRARQAHRTRQGAAERDCPRARPRRRLQQSSAVLFAVPEAGEWASRPRSVRSARCLGPTSSSSTAQAPRMSFLASTAPAHVSLASLDAGAAQNQRRGCRRRCRASRGGRRRLDHDGLADLVIGAPWADPQPNGDPISLRQGGGLRGLWKGRWLRHQHQPSSLDAATGFEIKGDAQFWIKFAGGRSLPAAM